MPEITYTRLEKDLPAMVADRLPAVCLVFGDPYLRRLAEAKLLNVMVPETERSLNYEVFEGPDGDVMGAVESLNTYAFLASGKVVNLKDVRVFHTRNDDKKLAGKAREEFARNNLSGAAACFLRFLKSQNLSAADVRKPEIRNELDLSDTDDDDSEWVLALADYCLKHKLSPPEDRDHAGVLEQAIRRGFPRGNRLLISIDKTDRRQALYKTIRDVGMIVDCALPEGSRLADKKALDAIVNDFVGFYMKPSGKTLHPKACQALVEATGPDLGLIAAGLDKLIDYTGVAPIIKADDVAAVSIRTREDPVFELTNAVAARNAVDALTVLASLLARKLAPQQIMSGVAKQMRKLLVAKDFTESPHGGAWKPGMQFPAFKNQVLPAMKAYDDEFKAFMDSGTLAMYPPDPPEEGGHPRKKAPKTDLPAAENTANPYPVYLSLKNADNYTREELIRSFIILGDAEWELRSPPAHHRTILERMIRRICVKNEV